MGLKNGECLPPSRVDIADNEQYRQFREKYNINLALHPDDPPRDLGGVERIMTSADNIDHAVNGIVKSDNLGITMCQATFHIMGENLNSVIERFKD